MTHSQDEINVNDEICATQPKTQLDTEHETQPSLEQDGGDEAESNMIGRILYNKTKTS